MMKKTILFFILILPILLTAQSPLGFKYQGVLRDAEFKPLKDQEIVVNINLLEGSATGNVVYCEYQDRMTNAVGLFSLTLEKVLSA
jgi:hypothetical protein